MDKIILVIVLVIAIPILGYLTTLMMGVAFAYAFGLLEF